MSWAGHVVCMGQERWVEAFGGDSEGRRRLGRTKGRLVVFIQLDFKDIVWEGDASTGLIWLRTRTSGRMSRSLCSTVEFL
jgi:hypothetical protein